MHTKLQKARLPVTWRVYVVQARPSMDSTCPPVCTLISLPYRCQWMSGSWDLCIMCRSEMRTLGSNSCRNTSGFSIAWAAQRFSELYGSHQEQACSILIDSSESNQSFKSQGLKIRCVGEDISVCGTSRSDQSTTPTIALDLWRLQSRVQCAPHKPGQQTHLRN